MWGQGNDTSNTVSRETWVIWNEGYESYSSTTGITSNRIWTYWTESCNSNSTTITANTSIWPRIRERSAEEVQRDLQLAEERNQARIRVEGERAQARERAILLLRESLSDRQRGELAEKGHFTLTVHDSKTQERRHYRIRKGREGNVDRVDENGKRLHGYCIHPAIRCPDEDTMLAQKLMLEGGQEQEFLQIANRRH